ncbi:MAG: hypothetical protein N2596_00530, partial [Syntrophorhabdaceae bacterium]|nr:hypothetical protein [Syntrophorhabdaceae bacterium]
MNHWMEQLALHYKKIRNTYPHEKLLIVFDIDGTILDMRFIILHVLKEFDKQHKTDYFKDIKVSDIDFHEAHLKILLNRLSIKEEDQQYILSYYENMFLPALTIKKANKPFRGVFDIIRWFQMQPDTDVGLNTGRPESLRFKTLSSLNLIGRDYGVAFKNELLFMNKKGLDAHIPHIKKDGIKYFQNLGYKVFAYVDNEPENLKAVEEIDREGKILLLHANTIFKSCKSHLKGNSVSGSDYELS